MTELHAIIVVIAIGFIAITIAVTVLTLFPLAREVREILRRVDSLLQATEGDMRSSVGEMRAMLQNVNQISAGIQQNMDKVSDTAEALEGFGKTIRKTSDIIQTTLHPSLLSFGALVVGLKTGSWYLLRRFFLKKKRR